MSKSTNLCWTYIHAIIHTRVSQLTFDPVWDRVAGRAFQMPRIWLQSRMPIERAINKIINRRRREWHSQVVLLCSTNAAQPLNSGIRRRRAAMQPLTHQTGIHADPRRL